MKTFMFILAQTAPHNFMLSHILITVTSPCSAHALTQARPTMFYTSLVLFLFFLGVIECCDVMWRSCVQASQRSFFLRYKNDYGYRYDMVASWI